MVLLRFPTTGRGPLEETCESNSLEMQKFRRRAPFWKYFWAQHFVTRQHVFNVGKLNIWPVARCEFYFYFQISCFPDKLQGSSYRIHRALRFLLVVPAPGTFGATHIFIVFPFFRTGAFSTAPMERREKYYMHSPKSEPNVIPLNIPRFERSDCLPKSAPGSVFRQHMQIQAG